MDSAQQQQQQVSQETMNDQFNDLMRRINEVALERFCYFAPELFSLQERRVIQMFDMVVKPHPYFQALLHPQHQFQISELPELLHHKIGPLLTNCFLHFLLIELYHRSAVLKQQVNKNTVHWLKNYLARTLDIHLRFPWERKQLWIVHWNDELIDWWTAIDRLRSEQFPEKIILTNPQRTSIIEAFRVCGENMYLHTFGDYDNEEEPRILDSGTHLPGRQILTRMEQIEEMAMA